MEITAKEISFVPVRMSLGATMLYHGASKLRGEGAKQSGSFFEQLGFRPGRRWAGLTGIAEMAAGASTILGFATRVGAIAVLATQAVAIAKVHRPKGFNNLAGGYEFNLLLVAAALGLLLAGPGNASVHELVEHRLGRGARGRFSPRRRKAVAVAKLLK